MKIGTKVMRNPKIWPDPKHQWVGKIIGTRDGMFVVDFNRTVTNFFTNKREKDKPTVWTRSELVEV